MPPSDEWVVAYDPAKFWNGTNYFGASLKSYELLGRRLGYALVGCGLAGTNAFFVREDLLRPPFPRHRSPPRHHYEPPRYWLARVRPGHRPLLLDRFRAMTLKDLVKADHAAVARREPRSITICFAARRGPSSRTGPASWPTRATAGPRRGPPTRADAGAARDQHRRAPLRAVGGHPPGAPLTMRGARASFLLCDGVLPACQMVEIGLQRPPRSRPAALSGTCAPRASPARPSLYQPSDLPIHRYSALLTAEERRSAAALGPRTPRWTHWPPSGRRSADRRACARRGTPLLRPIDAGWGAARGSRAPPVRRGRAADRLCHPPAAAARRRSTSWW